MRRWLHDPALLWCRLLMLPARRETLADDVVQASQGGPPRRTGVTMRPREVRMSRGAVGALDSDPGARKQRRPFVGQLRRRALPAAQRRSETANIGRGGRFGQDALRVARAVGSHGAVPQRVDPGSRSNQRVLPYPRDVPL